MSRPHRPIPPDVDRLRSSLAAFRKNHPKRSRLPEGLWKEAQRLAQKHGVAAVARGAGLGYTSLKRRLEDGGDAIPAVTAEAVPFVELRAVELFGDAAGAPGGTEVEIADDQGFRLRARLGPGGPPVAELGPLLAALWSRRR